MTAVLTLSASALCVTGTAALAEATVSVFLGANFSPHSNVTIKDGAGNQTFKDGVGWDGASFEMPPYYGVRATWWLEQAPEWGVALEFTHAKVKADPLPTGLTTLEFTDGINFVTANALYRYDMNNGWTPYGGLGIGLAIPHVETDGALVGGVKTLEYQVTGFAAQALIGVDYAIDNNWSVFAEAKSTYGVVEADLENNYSLDTNIISNQVLFGVTYSFR